MTMDNQIRKRYNFYLLNYFSNDYLTSWIEGIGNIGTGGFLETHLNGILYSGYFDTRTLIDYTGYFQCFSFGNELIYQPPTINNCYISSTGEHLDYTPFPTENGIWRTLQIRGYNPGPNVYGAKETTITYFMKGDTLINDLLYHKIYATKVDTIPKEVTTNQYVGAFRESDKTIYFWWKYSNEEQILYDFNIEVGDTILTTFDDVSTPIDIFLTKIDTIKTLDNHTRRRYQFFAKYREELMPFLTTCWVEGIGDIKLGVFSFPSAVPPSQGNDIFQCFQVDENLIYQNNNLEECYTKKMSLNAVDYSPLVLENATWILYNGEDDFTINTYFAYKIQGDTTINEIAYKKIYYYDLDKIGTSKFQIKDQCLAGIIREDKQNRKVYGQRFKPSAFGDRIDANCATAETEILLFDFTKKIGDSFEDCHTDNLNLQDSREIKIDTILEMYGQYRRVLKTGFGINLIEGIGYNKGLFLTPTGFIHAGYGYGIFDYCVDNNFNCNLLTSITNPISQKVKIFPNPVSTNLTLQFQQSFSGQLQLKTISGQMIYSIDFRGLNYELDIADFSRGCYFLHLQSEKGMLVRKIIIQ